MAADGARGSRIRLAYEASARDSAASRSGLRLGGAAGRLVKPPWPAVLQPASDDGAHAYGSCREGRRTSSSGSWGPKNPVPGAHARVRPPNRARACQATHGRGLSEKRRTCEPLGAWGRRCPMRDSSLASERRSWKRNTRPNDAPGSRVLGSDVRHPCNRRTGRLPPPSWAERSVP